MIVAVAFEVPYTAGLIVSKPRPARHADLLTALHALGVPAVVAKACVQGFLTDDGRFLDRKDAARHVWAHKQKTLGPVDRVHGYELLSEDLW